MENSDKVTLPVHYLNESGLLRYVLLLVAGASITLSFSPYNLWFVALVGLVIFARCIALASSTQEILKTAFAFGVGLFGAGVYWISGALYTYGGMSMPLAGLATLMFVFLWAFLFALPWCILPRFTVTAAQRLLFFAVIWFFCEWSRGWLLSGFPWLYLGYGQVAAPLQGWLSVVGVLGVGLLLTTVASLLVWVIEQRRSKVSIICLLAVAGIFIGGAFLDKVQWTKASGVHIPITIVQPNTPVEGKWHPDAVADRLLILAEQSQNAWQPGLLVWPEGAFPYVKTEAAQPYLDAINQKANRSNTAVITGLLTHDDAQGIYLNSAMGLGSAQGKYDKQRLVPFGEYVPLENWLRGTVKFFDISMSNLSKGASDQQPLRFDYEGQTYVLAPSICYEIAYSGLVRSLAKQANILLALSNDAWFGASAGPLQHMQVAQARAIENQKPLVRATNSGLSGLVDHRGVLYDFLPQFTQGVLSSTIEPREGMTFYAKWGDWPLGLLISLLLIVFFLYRLKRGAEDSHFYWMFFILQK